MFYLFFKFEWLVLGSINLYTHSICDNARVRLINLKQTALKWILGFVGWRLIGGRITENKLMLEPDNNPNPRLMVDPLGWLRHLMRWQFHSVTEPDLAVWG